MSQRLRLAVATAVAGVDAPQTPSPRMRGAIFLAAPTAPPKLAATNE